MSSVPETNADQNRDLYKAAKNALGFPLSRVEGLIISPQQATELAEQEAAFHTIVIDDNGMSGGMRLSLLDPVRALMSEWRQLREAFLTLLQPKMADIEAGQRLQAEADAEIAKKNEALEAVERELRQSPKYEDIDRHKQRAEALYEGFVERHGSRAAKMFAKNPIYWALIFCVGVTECFIRLRTHNQ